MTASGGVAAPGVVLPRSSVEVAGVTAPLGAVVSALPIVSFERGSIDAIDGTASFPQPDEDGNAGRVFLDADDVVVLPCCTAADAKLPCAVVSGVDFEGPTLVMLMEGTTGTAALLHNLMAPTPPETHDPTVDSPHIRRAVSIKTARLCVIESP